MAHARQQPDEQVDALGELELQNRLIADLLDSWEEDTRKLQAGDSVEVRWERGSAAKLLLQHLAVREAAKQDVVGRLQKVGHPELAARLEREGPQRREAIARLDEAARGMQAINLNNPDVDRAIQETGAVFRRDVLTERDDILPAIQDVLGPAGERGLPSARYVRMRSATHPSRTPRWFDKIGPIKAVRALYDHLRASPAGGTNPRVDRAREHTPGPRAR
jgi:hypothetical protein